MISGKIRGADGRTYVISKGRAVIIDENLNKSHKSAPENLAEENVGISIIYGAAHTIVGPYPEQQISSIIDGAAHTFVAPLADMKLQSIVSGAAHTISR